MKFFAFLSTLAILGTVSALPNPQPNLADDSIIVKRTPSDKSGKSQFVLQCEGTTIPNPGGAGGTGEGGSSYFHSNLLFNADGEKITGKDCKETSTTCTKCTFEGGGLESPTDVTGCWNPPGGRRGCSVEFDYKGHHYDSQDKQDKCGHESGFAPFAFDLSAICYFDV